MWSRTASSYSPGDSGGSPRQPSRDFVPSSWVESAQAAAKSVESVGFGLTAVAALGVIYLLGRGRK